MRTLDQLSRLFAGGGMGLGNCQAKPFAVRRDVRQMKRYCSRRPFVNCGLACLACGEECQKHAHMHEHCRICAESCMRCAQACRDALGDLH